MLIAERALLIFIAIIIDLIIGDPVYPFHPVRLFGRLIRTLEKWLRAMKCDGIGGGALLLLFSVAIPICIYIGLSSIIPNTYIQWAVDLFLYYSLISITDLNRHAMRVYAALKENDIQDAREKLSWIVGRDTKKLKKHQVARATVETIAESSSDGIVSPIFWGLLLGPVGIIGFKVINTLDSMVGYKNDKYHKFGMFSARADDVANVIPARLTLFLILIQNRIGPQAWVTAIQNRKKHSSPNSGHPEAAMAALLDMKMGGPSTYGGKVVEKPWINPTGKQATTEMIKKAHAIILWLAVELLIILFFIATTVPHL